MTTYSWTNAVSGFWSAKGNWSPAGGPPDAATADAVITASGNYTVTIATGESFMVDSLTFSPGAGGVLALNGKLTLGGTKAAMTIGSGTLSLAGTIAGGTLTVGSAGLISVTGNSLISSAVSLAGDTVQISSGKTLTLSGPVTWGGLAEVAGPGTLATTGTTTVNGVASGGGSGYTYINNGLTWVNSGTVIDSFCITNIGKFTRSSVVQTIINQANGIFDFTSGAINATGGFDAFVYFSGGGPVTFSNAGLLEKAAGTGTVSFGAALNSTGTVLVSSGVLNLNAGGTLAGTTTGTGSGVLQLGGGNFTTTGTLNILDSGAHTGLQIVNGATWTDSGTISDSGRLQLGNGSGTSALGIAAGARFNFSSDDGSITNGTGNTLSNAGTIAKTAGAGTSTLGVSFTNTGTVDAASGTLKLTGSVGGTGRLQIEAGGTLELATSSAVATNTVAFNGAGATLKLDGNFAPQQAIAGLGAGSRIDLTTTAAATAAIVNGNTLTITPTGGSALKFVSASSLAGLSVATSSDGGKGTVVVLSATGSVPIAVFATGVDNTGHVLAGGAVDPHYALVSSPAGAGSAFVVNPGIPISPAGPWVADNSTSQWIGPAANQANYSTLGPFDYQTKFDLTGLDPATAALKGLWSSDNQAVIKLNGVTTGITTGSQAFGALSNFSITSGFIAGSNTLDFIVTNIPIIGGPNNPTGLDVAITGTASLLYNQTYILQPLPTTITAAEGITTFIASDGALNSRDNLTGGPGSNNTLDLTGGGVFDLNAPKMLANIQVVTASEGQAAYSNGSTSVPGRSQIVFLRDGLNVTVNVASVTANSANPNPVGITIYGGNDASVINLGTGSDTVVLGSGSETVNANAAGGTGLVQATTTAQAGALVKGTAAAQTTLEITSGGTAALSGGTTYATVKLDAATNLTLSKLGFITAVGKVAGNTIIAGAAGQTLGGLAGGDTLVGSSAFGDIFQGTAAGLNGDFIKGFGGKDIIDVTNLGTNATPGYTGSATQGTLSLNDGSHSLSLSIAGTLSGGSFHIAGDGHGGSFITLS